MKSVFVLAMHGSPHRDSLPVDLAEFMALHGRLEASPVSRSLALGKSLFHDIY